MQEVISVPFLLLLLLLFAVTPMNPQAKAMFLAASAFVA